MENQPTEYVAITEFEVTDPAQPYEHVGEKLKFCQEKGDYQPAKLNRGYSLIFLLDNPLHYRVSQIFQNGTYYAIPKDRELNYASKSRLDPTYPTKTRCILNVTIK
jgi:hypothetical protein